MSAPSNLAKLFGGKKDEEDDAPSDDDVKKAKGDAFDAFFDAIHSKDREKARAAWDTLNGDDGADDVDADAAPSMGDE